MKFGALVFGSMPPSWPKMMMVPVISVTADEVLEAFCSSDLLVPVNIAA